MLRRSISLLTADTEKTVMVFTGDRLQTDRHNYPICQRQKEIGLCIGIVGRDCLQEWIGSREYAVELLRKAKGWEQCNDETFTYYACVVGNQRLMYRRNTMRTDGRKMFRLSDGLARLMMFDDLESMKHTLSSIQYWRGWGIGRTVKSSTGEVR